MDVLGKILNIEKQLQDIMQRRSLSMPATALVLGSGLGAVADALQNATIIPYGDLAGFPVSTAPGHKGRFVFGTLGGIPLVVMQGRVHYYEGYPMSDVVLPLRVLARLGVKQCVLTNAVGGINEGMQVGDFMLITDHISTFVPSPLTGPNSEQLGLRFPDMTQVYDLQLQAAIRGGAADCHLDLKEGVYAQLTGPHFETPTEIRLLQSLGIDVVGMSTVVEAIALRHMNIRVAGISCITNLAAGISDTPLCGEEVNQVGAQVGGHMTELLTAALGRFEPANR
ncbi:MAG: purine-nucleoside phosphorylase [Coriobacteriia bacterium]|nr:purine-nucleoside phosphorylase [Coriobacteriia bacterium]